MNPAIFPFLRLQGEQRFITEDYVSVPPALTIVDEFGAVWTIGLDIGESDKAPNGEYAFNVLRNGQEVGVLASRIERRKGRIRAFTKHGWKWWTGRNFV